MPIVRFENVTKQFNEGSFGVKEITFTIASGEFVFLTGPSGSGKTTLMRLLLKEYSFSSGEIFFHDTALSDVKNRHVHLHRRRIGVVFQDYKLIPEMNVWENIALPLWVMGKSDDEVERRVTDLLNLIKLPEKALYFPGQLSGGEAQRVGIARALAVGPEIVVADEPTGNLDSETAHSIARLLKKINELGTTVIIATHDKNILSSYPETRRISLESGALVTDSHPHRDSVSQNSHDKTSADDSQHDVDKLKSVHKSSDHKAANRKATEPEDSHAESDIPEDIHLTEHTRPEMAPKKPWWQKIFGTKKAKAGAETPKNIDQDKAHASSTKDTSIDERTKNDHNKVSANKADDDDLTEITEESLEDDQPIHPAKKEDTKHSAKSDLSKSEKSDKDQKPEVKEKSHKKK